MENSLIPPPHLPPKLRARKRKDKTYYYLEIEAHPRKEIPLGSYYATAIQKWRILHQIVSATPAEGINFRAVAERYKAEILPQKAIATQHDNLRELVKLYAFFDAPPAPLDKIEPIHIRQYLDWRVQECVNRLTAKGKSVRGNEGKIRANREKALFSHIWNFAREKGLTNKANPCAGVRNYKEPGRDIYITDETYEAVLAAADESTRIAMEMAYLTAQRLADVLKLSVTDIRDEALWIQQNKTKKRLRISIEGPLAALIARLTERLPYAENVRSTALICIENGKPLTKIGLRSRFDKARRLAAEKARADHDEKLALAIEAFQFRDLRAKAGTDKEERSGMAAAKDQLGHTNENMTIKYIRHRKGKLVQPTK